MKTRRLRETVPVIGTGFNQWLLRGAGAQPFMTSWWELLRTVANREDLFAAEPSLSAALIDAGDPTFAWEALMHASIAASGAAKRRAASEHENELLHKLGRLVEQEARRLAVLPVVQERAVRFIEALGLDGIGAGLICDLLSLNFDRILQEAWRASNPEFQVGVEEPVDEDQDKAVLWGIRPRWYKCSGPGGGDLRFWYPHGDASHPKTMVAGNLRYARATERVLEHFDSFRDQLRSSDAAQNTKVDRLPEHGRTFIRGSSALQCASWLAVAIDSPLLLLGVGLSRAESDLWAFLHLRARNHANIKPEQRPPIYRLTCRAERQADRAHWASLSPGIRIQDLDFGQTWDDAWNTLLCYLAQPSRRFP